MKWLTAALAVLVVASVPVVVLYLLGWWVIPYFVFLAVSLGVYVVRRFGYRAFTTYALVSGLAFALWAWGADTFPDLKRALPRAFDGWQFTKSVKIDPAAIEARKIVAEDCRDDESADTAKLNRDLQKFRDIRAKNGALTEEEQKAREAVLNRLAEIEQKKASCTARVQPPEPVAKPEYSRPPVQTTTPVIQYAPPPSVAVPQTVVPPPLSTPPPPKATTWDRIPQQRPVGAKLEAIPDTPTPKGAMLDKIPEQREAGGAVKVEAIPGSASSSR